MKPWQLTGLMFLGLGAVTGGSTFHPAATGARGPVWRTDLGAALEESRRSAKPLFVAFR